MKPNTPGPKSPARPTHRLTDSHTLPASLWRKIAVISLMSVLFLNGIISQPTSPCGCLESVHIGADNTTTNITDEPLSPNTCYVVHGTLDINDPTDWEDMIIQMDEGAEILVSTSLKIIDSYISGCDFMWRGIKTNTSTTLSITENTVIESAEFGALLADETKFTCQNTEFINNYIGIAVGNPFQADNTVEEINQSLQLTGCKFYTNINLPDPYPGQYYYPDWPSTPVGIPFNQGFAGIYLSSTTGLNIGADGALSVDRNEFYQLRNGIILRNAYPCIYSSDFHDFEGSVPKVISDPLLDLNQFGINVFHGYVYVQDNTFENIKRGIHLDGTFSTVNANYFDIPSNDLVPAANRGISGANNSLMTVTNNTILNGYKGIEINTAFNGHLLISNNDLERNISIPRNAAIELNDCRFTDQFGVVSLNDVTIHDATSSLGITLNRALNFDVTENTIVYTEGESAGNDNAGISIINGGYSYFAWNAVHAASEYEAFANNTGILGISQNNFFFCNDVDHFGSLMRFAGPSPTTSLFSNYFHDGTIGFELEVPAMIGVHQHRENKWLGTYTNGAFISGPASQIVASATGSRFIVNQNTNGNMPPNIGPSAVNMGNWFITQIGGGLECEEPPHPLVSYEEDTLISLIHYDFDFGEYSAHMEWQVKADIFEIILNHPGLTSNPVLDSFFDTEGNTNLGKLILAQDGLSSRYGVNQSSKDDVADKIISLSRDLVYIDSVLSSGGPINIATWTALRMLKVDSLTMAHLDWIDLLDDEETATMAEYDDIRTGLRGLTSANDLEDYLKNALILRAQYLLGEGLSASDSSDLVDFIHLCPIEGGRAIGIAQGLYSIIADSNMVTFVPACPVPAPFSIFSPSGPAAIDNSELSVYPNPGTGDFQIIADDQILDINVYSPDFKLISTFQPDSHTEHINIGHLGSGIYLLNIRTSKGTSTRRITLLK